MDNKQKKISIVVPSWFKKEGHDGRYGKFETFNIASECLNRLMTVIPEDLYELIIIDNGSDLTDDDVVNEKFSFTPSWYFNQADILIRNKFNRGFGFAMNQGFACATGEYILALNNDVVMWEGCVEELLKTFDLSLSPKVGAVMPALDRSGIRFPEIMTKNKEEIDMQTNAGKYGVHAQFGSAFMVKKSVLEELYKRDGFYLDPQFKFLFREDRDLWERIYSLGLETYRNHNTRVNHIGNLTVSKVENHKEISIKNRELFDKKWNKQND